MRRTRITFSCSDGKLCSYKTKEKKEGPVYTFYGASTIPDRASGLSKDGVKVEGEILTKSFLEKAAFLINNPTSLSYGSKVGSFITVSLFHDNIHYDDFTLEEAGFIVPKSARVEELPYAKGEYGLMVDVKLNEKYTPSSLFPDYDFEKIKYKIDNNAIGLSIEYNNKPEHEKVVYKEGKPYLEVSDFSEFLGFGFARANLIGNPTAIKIKEILSKKGEKNMSEQKDNEKKEVLEEVKKTKEELEKKIEDLKKDNEKTEEEKKEKEKELSLKLKEIEQKYIDLKLKSDEDALKIKESFMTALSSLKYARPPRNNENENKEVYSAKIKEAYGNLSNGLKNKEMFKETVLDFINGNKQAEKSLREQFNEDSEKSFNFLKNATLKVKTVGNKFILVPTAKTKSVYMKTKDTINSDSMSESTYYQTNAMFADLYLAEITETFLKEDNLLKALPKVERKPVNDKVQWKLWTTFDNFSGDNTSSVNPRNTSVSRRASKYEKMETRICEYREGVEVEDFADYHSIYEFNGLLTEQLNRASEIVSNSMDSDLFKSKTDASTGWNGFIGLIGVADSSTHTTIYGKTRTVANRLKDSTLANTYVSTSEAISVSKIRAGVFKVLAQGSSLNDLVIVMHPTQYRKLMDTEDSKIMYTFVKNLAPPTKFGFTLGTVPYIDGVPVILDYYCESSANAADMFAVVDLSVNKGFVLYITKNLSIRNLAKVGASESAYISFYGSAVYKSPRNVFVHTGLTV